MSGIDKMKNKAEELRTRSRKSVAADRPVDLQAVGQADRDRAPWQAAKRRNLRVPKGRTQTRWDAAAVSEAGEQGADGGEEGAVGGDPVEVVEFVGRAPSAAPRARARPAAAAGGRGPTTAAGSTRRAPRRRRRRPAPPRRRRPAARSSTPSSSRHLAHEPDGLRLPRLDLAAGELPAAVVGPAGRWATSTRSPSTTAAPTTWTTSSARRAAAAASASRCDCIARSMRAAQHDLLERGRPAPPAARCPSRPARRPACPRRWR